MGWEETPQELKARWRREILARRRALGEEEVERRSAAVQEQVLRHPAFAQAKVLALYVGVKGEVRTDRLLRAALEAGRRVALPITLYEEGMLRFSEVREPERELRPARFGLLEPAPEHQRPVAPEEFDWVLVPGVVFDRRGYRLGHGKGFYDRFLAQVRPDCVRAGLAYDFQVVEALPVEAHDVRLHLLFTESQVLEFL